MQGVQPMYDVQPVPITGGFIDGGFTTPLMGVMKAKGDDNVVLVAPV
jgi:uncharacterized protein YaaQ